MGLSPKRYERPLGLQALIQNYAILAYCRLQETPRVRLTRTEFKKALPKLRGVGLGMSRYAVVEDEGDAKVRLALLLPDFDSDYLRLVRKARREFLKRRDHPDREVRGAFRDLVRGDNFRVIVLTAFDEKARLINTEFRDEAWAWAEVVPELRLLLGRASYAKQAKGDAGSRPSPGGQVQDG